MKQEIEKITAVTLLVDCLELGEISAVKASALAVSRMKKKNVLTEFYERQLARGKSKMSALQEKTNVEPQFDRHPHLKITQLLRAILLTHWLNVLSLI